MIKQYCVYNEDGKILLSAYGETDDDLSGFELTLQGYFDPNKYYVDVVNKTAIEIPPSPSEDHRFNYKTKQWELYLPIEVVVEKVIWQRGNLLQQSDWTQIPNGPLTQEQQQSWAVYRQQLRDITSQSGYPFNVVWPTPPQG